jgi:hypothetical protein
MGFQPGVAGEQGRTAPYAAALPHGATLGVMRDLDRLAAAALREGAGFMLTTAGPLDSWRSCRTTSVARTGGFRAVTSVPPSTRIPS